MMMCYILGIDTRAMNVSHAIKVFAWSERFETFIFSTVYIRSNEAVNLALARVQWPVEFYSVQ